MSWLFSPRKTPADLLRENKRTLDKAIRELDRERTSLQQQEKKLVGEIKQMAKQNQMAAVRVMAKDLIRTRHSVTKFYSLKSQLQGVSLRMQTLKSTQSMADAMRHAQPARAPPCLAHPLSRRGVTRAMAGMNKQLNLPALQNIMREFERQNERMDMTTEARLLAPAPA
jgi:charged multivesicular body protein 2A